MANDVQLVALRGILNAAGQDMAHPDNGVHRRPYFMTDIGNKLGFRPTGRLGFSASGEQFCIAARQAFRQAIEHLDHRSNVAS